MKCNRCVQRPELRLTGFSQFYNNRPEWECPVCGLKYWTWRDGSLHINKEKEPKQVIDNPTKTARWS